MEILKSEKTLKSVENTDRQNSFEILERNEIEGTPIIHVISRNEESEIHFGAIGLQKVTPDFAEEKELKKWIKNNYLNLALTISVMVVEKQEKLLKLKEETTNEN